MANCEKPGCTNRATKILSVGSLGREETLCEQHVNDEIRKLEPMLVPHHVTGIDAPFSGEESLAERVGVLDTARAELLAQLDDARHENARLRELLVSRLEEQNERLRAELRDTKDEMGDLNAALTEPAEPVTRVDG